VRLSFSSRFARLSLIAFSALLLLTVSGWLVTQSASAQACAGWPLCRPTGVGGWVNLMHRAASGLTAGILLVLLHQAGPGSATIELCATAGCGCPVPG
jgi:heme A synthase